VSRTDVDQPFFEVHVDDEDAKKELEEISNADFIAFDDKFFDILGKKPNLKSFFGLEHSPSLREALIYVPELNTMFASDMGTRKQMKINLTNEPTLEYIELKPHLDSINGAIYLPKIN